MVGSETPHPPVETITPASQSFIHMCSEQWKWWSGPGPPHPPPTGVKGTSSQSSIDLTGRCENDLKGLRAPCLSQCQWNGQTDTDGGPSVLFTSVQCNGQTDADGGLSVQWKGCEVLNMFQLFQQLVSVTSVAKQQGETGNEATRASDISTQPMKSIDSFSCRTSVVSGVVGGASTELK